MFAALALTALCLEAAFGYPDALYRRIGHPVTWLGALIAWCDRRWNSDAASFARRRVNGVATLVLLFAVAVSVGLAIAVGATKLVSAVPGLVVTALAASWLLAQRSLYTHVAAVAQALEQKGLLAGRKAVSMIVGRDPDRLDEPAVAAPRSRA